MRQVQARFLAGDAWPTSHLAAFGPDANGALDADNAVEGGNVRIHPRDDDVGWLEGGWLDTPWLGQYEEAGWLNAAWLEQAWLEEVAEIAVTIGPFEYGPQECAGKAVDALAKDSAMSPAGTVLVNSAPPGLRSATVTVNSNVVTMTVALHLE